jgi:hypothetical protein
MNKERITYEILEDGYMLNLDGKPWIKQHKEHAFYPEKSLEENAELHIEELCKEVKPEPTVEEQITEMQLALAEIYETMVGGVE